MDKWRSIMLLDNYRTQFMKPSVGTIISFPPDFEPMDDLETK